MDLTFKLHKYSIGLSLQKLYICQPYPFLTQLWCEFGVIVLLEHLLAYDLRFCWKVLPLHHYSIHHNQRAPCAQLWSLVVLKSVFLQGLLPFFLHPSFHPWWWRTGLTKDRNKSDPSACSSWQACALIVPGLLLLSLWGQFGSFSRPWLLVAPPPNNFYLQCV